MQTAVIGAGLMGAEIALVQALAGFEVRLIDRTPEALALALQRLAQVIDKAIVRGELDAQQRTGLLAHIRPQVGMDGLVACEWLTEAVFEDLDLKRTVLAEAALATPDDCLIASNTSTLPIAVLAAALPAGRRGNFIGSHYFSPVSRMPLVEVIPGFETHDAITERMTALARTVGKTPIRIKDVPGFAVNRMLHAFIIEAVRLAEEGVASPEDLDTACRLGLGHPIGPFALMDAVTSSLCIQAQEIMQDAYGERFRPPPLLKQRVAAGYVGGRGRPGWLTKGPR